MYRNYGKGGKAYPRTGYTRRTHKSEGSFSELWDRFKDIYVYGRPKKRKNAAEKDEEFGRKAEKRQREKGGQPPEDEKPPAPKPVIPKPNVLTEEDLAKRLHVKELNFHIAENTKEHHTDKYECTEQRKNDADEDAEPELVIRRGQKFKMTITFDRPYEKKENDLEIIFSTGEMPLENKGTKASVIMDETSKNKVGPYGWGASFVKKNGNDVTLDVSIPAKCIIGEWEIKIKTSDKGKTKDGKEMTMKCVYEHDETFYILFNPWCKDDQVYFEDVKLLNEYILNEGGCIFVGNQYSIFPKPWNFGQFEEGVLDISLHIVRKGLRFKEEMADPVRVARVISKMVNSLDDDGVLVGNWSGNYEYGTRPTEWVGSVKMLRQYIKEGEPVKYGQCWVFSALVTTVCRALGIPALSVTNFSSAHDTEGNTTIDAYFTDDGDELVSHSNDSVWNFHVWNEVWFSRPHLKTPYQEHGWQAIDATPQEASGGVYQCGPAPLKAIKNGDCDVPYDTKFIFAEVNADRIQWVQIGWDEFEVQQTKPKSVGKFISTKIPDGKKTNWRHDITDNYKYEEGSAEERASVAKAKETATEESYINRTKLKKKDVVFSLVHKDDVMIGEDLKITLQAYNKGDTSRTIEKTVFKIYTCDYTGKKDPKDPFKHEARPEIEIGKGGECEIVFMLQANDYVDKLIEQAFLKIVATAVVKGTESKPREVEIKSHDFRFTLPGLTVKLPNENLKIGKSVNVEVSLKNPLYTELNNCILSMESAGFRPFVPSEIKEVRGKAEVKLVAPVVPKRRGEHQIGFTLETPDLPDTITGEAVVTVT